MILLAYLKYNQPKSVNVRLGRGFCAFLIKLLWHQEFRGHELYRAALRFSTAGQLLYGVRDNGHKTKVREAGMRRGVVGHEYVRLRNVKMGSIAKRTDTNPFEVPVCEMSTM